jgi:hypothetical protein
VARGLRAINVSEVNSMPKKLMDCVRKVKAKNRGAKKKVNPWAVCVASTGLKPEHKKKK